MYRWPFLLGVMIAVVLPALLAADDPSPDSRKRVLLLGQSPDGHPPSTHEYMAGVKLLADCLKPVSDIETVIVRADDPWSEGPELIAEADGVVLFLSEGAKWIQSDPRRMQAMVKLAERQGGLVVLHWGMGTRDAEFIEGFVNLFGGCHGGPDRKYQVLANAQVNIVDAKHPVVRGVKPFRLLREEFYYRLKFAKPESTITSLLQTEIEGNPETVCWAWQRPDGGRSFGFSGGHFHANWERLQYRRLMAQAVLWTVNLPIPENGLAVDLPK